MRYSSQLEELDTRTKTIDEEGIRGAKTSRHYMLDLLLLDYMRLLPAKVARFTLPKLGCISL
jgi:hypothetical protein